MLTCMFQRTFSRKWVNYDSQEDSGAINFAGFEILETDVMDTIHFECIEIKRGAAWRKLLTQAPPSQGFNEPEQSSLCNVGQYVILTPRVQQPHLCLWKDLDLRPSMTSPLGNPILQSSTALYRVTEEGNDKVWQTVQMCRNNPEGGLYETLVHLFFSFFLFFANSPDVCMLLGGGHLSGWVDVRTHWTHTLPDSSEADVQRQVRMMEKCFISRMWWWCVIRCVH